MYGILLAAFLGCVSMFGFVSSYARMVWKVADYNSLRDQITSIRSRYERLQSESNQTKEQLAALQLFASEVSFAYGIKNKLEGPPDIAREGRLVPTFRESLAEYNTLKSANFSHFYRTYARRWQTNIMPSIWPLEGRLLSSYGNREDPFRGMQAFHAGVDISADMGTAVRSAGDGIVVFAEYNGAYGRLVIVDHGGGIETYYAHLSRFDVIAGQEVRRGQVIAHSGASGRVTSPHLHYEVRHGGNPVNPYRYLARSSVAQNVKKDFPF